MLKMILVWNELFADDAVVYLNNSKMDKQTLIAGFKGHHSIFMIFNFQI